VFQYIMTASKLLYVTTAAKERLTQLAQKGAKRVAVAAAGVSLSGVLLILALAWLTQSAYHAMTGTTPAEFAINALILGAVLGLLGSGILYGVYRYATKPLMSTPSPKPPTVSMDPIHFKETKPMQANSGNSSDLQTMAANYTHQVSKKAEVTATQVRDNTVDMIRRYPLWAAGAAFATGCLFAIRFNHKN
jgi:hypothetical protein